jgi:hypothetical protein
LKGAGTTHVGYRMYGGEKRREKIGEKVWNDLTKIRISRSGVYLRVGIVKYKL